MPSLLIVSNRLPVTVGDTIAKSSGGMVAALEGIAADHNLQWIGWAGSEVRDPRQREAVAAQLKERFNYTPLFLSDRQVAEYYTGYANMSLWPLLHYMPSQARYEDQWLQTYRTVNRIFADTILEQATDGDLIWIQDYHLMLLPAMLREKRPDLTIGFFLHTPFPSYEIFRCHPDREELLEGLLGADLIGFHTFGYLRHFRSTVLRILGLESHIDTIVGDVHRTDIGVFPIGINVAKFRKGLASEKCETVKNTLRQRHEGKKIVLSVERLDYTKGVVQRLDAIERFLAETGRTDVVFIFVSVPSRESVPEYQQLRRTVDIKISRINGKYASLEEMPVHFIHHAVEFEELCALYSLADVATITPLMDGMNLVAKEYLLCQQKENAGALVLSEFCGAAQELHDAWVVNPYDIRQIAANLRQALDADAAEKQRRLEPMKARVTRYDAHYWAESFLKELASLTAGTEPRVGAAACSMAMEAVQPHLQGVRAALFLDYDGTLAELRRRPTDAFPQGDVLRLLSRLDRQKTLEVCLMGGRSREEMSRWFSAYDFHLIAEHGYCWKARDAAHWTVPVQDADLSWKDQIREFLVLYADMTPGSVLEEKTASLVWHYGSIDPEFGRRRAQGLVSEMQEILSNLPVTIRHGNSIVEIASIHANKGAAVAQLIARGGYDAVLCSGDDETDETVFRLNDPRILSIKVGPGQETAAAYRCPSPRALRDFLDRLLSGF